MRRHTVLLIGVNAFAAASSFVASWFVGAQLAVFPLPILAVVLGLVGVAHFTRRAEELHRSLRNRPEDAESR
jgi:hypothetical protein